MVWVGIYNLLTIRTSTNLRQNTMVFGYIFLCKIPLARQWAAFKADNFFTTMYLMLDFSGDAEMTCGCVMPTATVMTLNVSLVTVAVKAIMCTDVGIILHTSPKRA